MKVGFIGLGIMGKPMAKNLLKAGHDVYVNDLNKDAVAELVAAGAHAGESNANVAKNVEVVITMVPNSPHVRAAVLGEGGVIEGATSYYRYVFYRSCRIQENCSRTERKERY